MDLVSCAKANAKYGLDNAAQQCGYTDVREFAQVLKQTCDRMGVDISQMSDLITQ
jgi:hypothetical protein